MRYIKRIELPYVQSNIHRLYPANVIDDLDIDSFGAGDITVIYGSNGSGKSTLLNLLAKKFECEKEIQFDPHPTYDYDSGCLVSLFDEIADRIVIDNGKNAYMPANRRLITSAEVMNCISQKVKHNTKVSYGMNMEMSRRSKWEWGEDGEIAEGAMYLKKLTERDFFLKASIYEKDINSNGEEMLRYFEEKLEYGGLYLLDEPENCLSPIFQTTLASIVSQLSTDFNCQFFIATHSPFFISLPNAKIVNLDKRPVTFNEKWYELDNMKPYFYLFNNKDMY